MLIYMINKYDTYYDIKKIEVLQDSAEYSVE